MVLARIDLSPPLLDCGREVLAGLGLSAALQPGSDFPSIALKLPSQRPELCQEYLTHLILKAWARPFRVTWEEPASTFTEDQAWLRIYPPGPAPAESPTLPTDALQQAYQASPLHHYHQHYFGEEPHPPSLWPDTYDRIDPRQFPACISIFLNPEGNFPGWQQESGILHFTRGLLGMGWHPRHIAGLIQSRLCRGQEPYPDAWNRIDEKVRCYSGLIHQGLDQLLDFDCGSVQSQGFCPPHPRCPVDLCQLKGHLGCGGWHP